MKHTNLSKVICALTIGILIALNPTNVFASSVVYETTANCETCKIRTIPLADQMELLTITTDEGNEYRVVTKVQEEKQGTTLFFWVIQNDIELDMLQQNLDVKQGNLGEAHVNGSVGLPSGGWVYWDDNTIVIYISPDLAATWIAGTAITAILCGIVAVLPMGALPGLVCATVFGLSAATIDYYNDAGGPGFYIKGTRDPLRVWLEP